MPAESFIVPADIVSSIGQGNTEAGFAILEKHWPPIPEHRASGGSTGKTPIVAAGGEFGSFGFMVPQLARPDCCTVGASFQVTVSPPSFLSS